MVEGARLESEALEREELLQGTSDWIRDQQPTLQNDSSVSPLFTSMFLEFSSPDLSPSYHNRRLTSDTSLPLRPVYSR